MTRSVLNEYLYNNKCFVVSLSAALGWIWACDGSLEPSCYKNDHVMGTFPFARAARPQRAKMRSAHYISYLKVTVLRVGPL